MVCLEPREEKTWGSKRTNSRGILREPFSSRRSHGRRAFTHAQRIVLINVHANVQGRNASEDHQRFTEWAALCVLSESHFALQNGAFDWGTYRQSLGIYFVLMNGCLRLCDLSAGNLEVAPRPQPWSALGLSPLVRGEPERPRNDLGTNL